MVAPRVLHFSAVIYVCLTLYTAVVAEGMSTDSEEDIYTTPPTPTTTPATTPQEGKEEDNPVYHDSNDTTQAAPVHITVEGTNDSPDPLGIEDTSSEKPIDAVSSILAVKGTNKERASSMRETHTSVEDDGITEPDGVLSRQRSVSQPDEHSAIKKATEVIDFLVATASSAFKQAIDIPPKTQIGKILDIQLHVYGRVVLYCLAFHSKHLMDD